MSMRSLETEIISKAREILKNPKIRVKDMMEWSTGEIDHHDGEVTIFIPSLQVYVAFKKENDKREGTVNGGQETGATDRSPNTALTKD